ncbi:acetaldehyde dehydrogenase (acetylating) [Candidatus Parvarchaeota archaeon]|nr:acetaldehyde dehydrogenase (acetylating) [Candidatus Parvarchaeota archaeon]
MEKLKVAILGTGNIGSDLLAKVMRSKYLECALFVGQNNDSEGMKKAQALGIKTSDQSIGAIEQNPGCCSIVFDATSAPAHMKHAPILERLGKFTLDLTPAKTGKMCIPILNLEQCLGCSDVNMVSCGGQSSIPVAYALAQSCPKVGYIELATSIASKSAGPGTRINLDEYIETTRKGIEVFTGVKRAKAILNLNPAVPPIDMHNTLYMEMDNKPDMETIRKNVVEMIGRMQKFTPGIKLVAGPVWEEGRVTVITDIVGAGDFLPRYAGNLDIMTCAAVAVAEEYAKKAASEKGQ